MRKNGATSKTPRAAGTTIDNIMTITLGMGPLKIILYRVAEGKGLPRPGGQGKGKEWQSMDRKKCLPTRELKEQGVLKTLLKGKKKIVMREGETVLLKEQEKGHLCEKEMGHPPVEESLWIALWIKEDHRIEEERVHLNEEEQNHLTEEEKDLLTEDGTAPLKGEEKGLTKGGGKDLQTDEPEIKNPAIETGMIIV